LVIEELQQAKRLAVAVPATSQATSNGIRGIQIGMAGALG
jgi:hypothetical protein